MNERIKELAHNAEFINKRHNGDEWRWGYIDPELADKLEKFAKLIVRECSQMVHDSHPDDLPFVGGKMLVHFGVEE